MGSPIFLLVGKVSTTRMYFCKSLVGVVIFLSTAGSTLKCWDCRATCLAKNNDGHCVSDLGCKWTGEEKKQCEKGVNHCMKLDYADGNVTRGCAYFSLTPIQLNQDVLLGSLEGTCFKGIDSPAVKKIEDCTDFPGRNGKCIEALQCPAKETSVMEE
eukprot:TRINITY_DN31661_c0_g1_i1.p1 TRINITY_DN31661_c0_g1~~TRINITY_DN31661_c0_g1_i1.p1  ORF type:complete len:165 (-),score=36.81 TRINITY_DN31661_c0_g1_i1:278-748(-)